MLGEDRTEPTRGQDALCNLGGAVSLDGIGLYVWHRNRDDRRIDRAHSSIGRRGQPRRASGQAAARAKGKPDRFAFARQQPLQRARNRDCGRCADQAIRRCRHCLRHADHDGAGRDLRRGSPQDLRDQKSRAHGARRLAARQSAGAGALTCNAGCAVADQRRLSSRRRARAGRSLFFLFRGSSRHGSICTPNKAP